MEDPTIQWVGKIAGVPQIVHEERLIEVPETLMQYLERIVDVLMVLHEERLVVVPQALVTETVTEIPVSKVEFDCQVLKVETPYDGMTVE